MERNVPECKALVNSIDRQDWQNHRGGKWIVFVKRWFFQSNFPSKDFKNQA